ncbi:hypothetical protein ACPOL_1983 [Acidisarcina polymorpha]|uniref:DUF72 domain-containing protein n=1 Tax=Acidisarcina polymorpha TaxID=2211140 RepID=A0A2Z5FWQ4_9BACT|nr:hypothetical protein ACPOL_1983 [Acidisarcina polymorpha]
MRIGISGWRYKGWRGVFYPKNLAQRRELEFASRRFNTIELNGSFYSLQRPSSFETWCAETPDDFVFAVKGSRYITHMLKLRNIEVPLANFFAQGVLRLGPKLGPVLWQFPPNFKFEAEKLDAFFRLLPRTQKEAAELGRLHDKRLDQRSWLEVKRSFRLRHAVEIRHDSFACDAFIQMLRHHDVGLVVADTVEWPLLMDVTADFVYCRLHGSEQLYASGYEDEALDRWARRIASWAAGGEVRDGKRAGDIDAPKRKKRDVFVYFDNDMKVRAPVDAQALQTRVKKLLEAS